MVVRQLEQQTFAGRLRFKNVIAAAFFTSVGRRDSGNILTADEFKHGADVFRGHGHF